MSDLLVIHKKLNFFEKAKIINKCKKKNNFILDLFYEKNKLFYEDNRIEKFILKNNIFLKKNFLNIKSKYEKKIAKLLKKKPSYAFYKFTELNLSDFWWKSIFHAESIKIFCHQRKINKIEFLEDFKSNLSDFFYNIDENKKKNKKLFFLLNFQFYYKIYLIKIFFFNFIKEVLSLIYFRNKSVKLKKQNNHIIFTTFPYGWKLKGQTFSRFFGKNISNKKNTYLFSITRNNQYNLIFDFKSLNRLKNIKSHRILEAYGSLKNIIYNYFLVKKNKDQIFNDLKILFKNEFIANILTNGIFTVEIPQRNILIHNLKKFYSENKIKKILISIPEFVDGRAINYISNKNHITTYALQHASIGILQHSRFVNIIKSLDKIDKNYLPNNMLVENVKIKEQFKNAGFSTRIVGNLRFRNPSPPIKKFSDNIYYIAEMYNNILLEERLKILLKKFSNNYVYVRPHPGKKIIQTKIISKIKGYKKNLLIDQSKNITIGLKKIKPGLIFTSSSSVYVELISNNFKTILMNDDKFFTNYPADIDKNKIIIAEKFITKEFEKKIHKVSTNIYGNFAEKKLIKSFYEK